MRTDPAQSSKSEYSRPGVATATHRGLRTKLFRRQPWETIAILLIAAGVLMLLQPFSLALYSYSLMTMLAGIVAFTIVSKFPE